jgi:anthranilate phosphoribosyltransferase
MLSALTADLARGLDLSAAGVADALEALTSPDVPPEPKAEFLAALAAKGETPAEIAALAAALRARATPLPLPAGVDAAELLDVCGTGGDRLGTFNISTTAGLVCAAAGVRVAKHGNRAITSRSGSADVLAALGVPTELPPAEAGAALAAHGFVFLLAPRYHPAFQHIAPARKLCAARGQRTVFNFLGPLLNPARPGCQLTGLARPELASPVARTLQTLGARRAMAVCGRTPEGFLDELSTLGPSTVAEFHHARGFSESELDPAHFPLQPATLADLAGGDAPANADLIRGLLAGDDRGPRRDALLLNAGAALFVAGRARSIGEGWELAAATLDSGAAARKLAELTP